MPKTLSLSQLTFFSPLNGLKTENLHALAKKIEVQEAKPGGTLFKEGDKEKRTVYVVSGTVQLREGGEVLQTVTGGTDAARNAISPQLPRQLTAVATSDVEFIAIDNQLLDVTLTWDQTGVYEVGDFTTEQDEETGDWMTSLLQIKVFQKIPPANIQTIFERLQQVNYKARDTVIKQGDKSDYFYVISRGSCMVTRETAMNTENIDLAEMAVGATFGEESLISGEKRNATISMQTDGVLMRLGKDDFQTLLMEPLLELLDHDEAEKVVADGGRWLDVRMPNEFEASHEDGAVNEPLYSLRLRLNTLDPKTKYVVCCDTGRRSSAAAFILIERGFQAAVLKGGLKE